MKNLPTCENIHRISTLTSTLSKFDSNYENNIELILEMCKKLLNCDYLIYKNYDNNIKKVFYDNDLILDIKEIDLRLEKFCLKLKEANLNNFSYFNNKNNKELFNIFNDLKINLIYTYFNDNLYSKGIIVFFCNFNIPTKIDMDNLELVSSIIDRELENYYKTEDLKYCFEFQKLLTHISLKLSENSNCNIGEVIDYSLESIVKFTKVSLGCLYEYNKKENSFICEHSYLSDKKDEIKLKKLVILDSIFMNSLKSSKPIFINKENFCYIINENYNKYVIIPIICNSTKIDILGFLCLAIKENNRKLKESEIDLLQIMGYIFSSAISRYNIGKLKESMNKDFENRLSIWEEERKESHNSLLKIDNNLKLTLSRLLSPNIEVNNEL